MTTKTITDQAGDTVRISTGTLTAPTGHVTVKVNEHYLGREYSAAAHADPAALRAALDEVAPLGKYTRTTPDPDDMDGGVAAALIEKEAEEPNAEVRELRSALARETARGNALQDALDAAESRPLTPDAINASVKRAEDAYHRARRENRPDALGLAVLAALTEPPARPLDLFEEHRTLWGIREARREFREQGLTYKDVRRIVELAFTPEPPARPEGAEDVAVRLFQAGAAVGVEMTEEQRDALADHLAAMHVRVVAVVGAA